MSSKKEQKKTKKCSEIVWPIKGDRERNHPSTTRASRNRETVCLTLSVFNFQVAHKMLVEIFMFNCSTSKLIDFQSTDNYMFQRTLAQHNVHDVCDVSNEKRIFHKHKRNVSLVSHGEVLVKIKNLLNFSSIRALAQCSDENLNHE